MMSLISYTWIRKNIEGTTCHCHYSLWLFFWAKELPWNWTLPILCSLSIQFPSPIPLHCSLPFHFECRGQLLSEHTGNSQGSLWSGSDWHLGARERSRTAAVTRGWAGFELECLGTPTFRLHTDFETAFGHNKRNPLNKMMTNGFQKCT